MSKNIVQYSIGVDIGGTKMAAVLFNGDKVIADYMLATPTDSLNHFLIMLKALVEPLVEKARQDKTTIRGLGAGVAGALDNQADKILVSPNLSFLNGLKLADEIEAKIKLPVRLDNDANCFLRAEALVGAAKNQDNVFGLTIGTGIGGAWWLNKEIYRGSHGGAGEPGHLMIDLDAGLDLEATYQKLTQNNAERLAQEAYRADPLAEKAFAELARHLGIGLANVVNLIDPALIVVGGSVVKSGDLFLNQTKKIMRQHILSAEAKKIKVIKGKLGDTAGAIGAALLVGEQTEK